MVAVLFCILFLCFHSLICAAPHCVTGGGESMVCETSDGYYTEICTVITRDIVGQVEGII